MSQSGTSSSLTTVGPTKPSQGSRGATSGLNPPRINGAYIYCGRHRRTGKVLRTSKLAAGAEARLRRSGGIVGQALSALSRSLPNMRSARRGFESPARS